MPEHAGPMGITDGQLLRFKKEIRIFSYLCSYFDKLQEPQASPQDTDSAVLHSEALLVISHNYLQTTDCAELASSLTQDGVSPPALAHALLRTSVPKAPMQQLLFGGAVSAREEGWLDESVRSSEQNRLSPVSHTSSGNLCSGMQKQLNGWLVGEGTVEVTLPFGEAGGGCVDGDAFTHQKCIIPEGWPKSNGIQESSQETSSTGDGFVHVHKIMVGLATTNLIFLVRTHARTFAH